MSNDSPERHERFGRLLDLWETGLLDETDDHWMREHAAGCEACRGLLTPTPTTDADAGEGGGAPSHAMRHLPPAMIAAWHRARTELSGLERRLVARHLERCAACREELTFLGHEPSLEPHGAAPPTHGDDRSWIARLSRVMERLADLAVREPLPVAVMRSAPATPAEAARLRGLEAYASGAYSDAERHLAEAAMASDDAETWLYLGSSRLLQGRAADAASALRTALDRAGSGPVADEARWQLVNAMLISSAPRGAVELAEVLVQTGGRRASDATGLLERLQREAGNA